MTAVDVNILCEIKASLAAQYSCFPHGCCIRASSRVERAVDLEHVTGLFIDDKGIGHSHDWNRDRDTGEIIDLTIEQFGISLRGEPFLVTPPDSDLAQRYVENVMFAY